MPTPGIGANPHFGTPGNPADRKRVPGGSSSGAAVAAADGMCEIAIGTDTGGSCRIPGALCGIVGYKPSRQRIPTDGAFPLSYSIDSIGPIARSVEACAKADAVMAGEDLCAARPARSPDFASVSCRATPLENLDETVDEAVFRCGRTAEQGWRAIYPKKSCRFSTTWRRSTAKAASSRPKHFPFIAIFCRAAPTPSTRMCGSALSVRAISAPPTTLIWCGNARASSGLMDARLADLDVLALPTTPIVAPTMQEVAQPDEFARKNAMLLRNTRDCELF